MSDDKAPRRHFAARVRPIEAAPIRRAPASANQAESLRRLLARVTGRRIPPGQEEG